MRVSWERLGWKGVTVDRDGYWCGYAHPREGLVARFARWRESRRKFDWSGWTEMGYVDETDGE